MGKWFQNKNWFTKKWEQGVKVRKAHRDTNTRKMHRALGVLLAAALIFQTAPFNGTAVSASESGGGLCTHHRSHTPDCGYKEAEQGHDCTHAHTEDCYRIVEEEDGSTTKEPDCHHAHDESCGYWEAAEGSPCTFVCEICNGGADGTSGDNTDGNGTNDGDSENPGTENGDEIEEPGDGQEECICKELCTEDSINTDCPVCGAESASLSDCKGKDTEDSTEDAEENTDQQEDTGLCKHHPEHDESCGYLPESEDSEGSPCTYACRICPIEELIAVLPDATDITEDNAEEVRAQLEEILALYRELTGEEQGQIDLSRCYALQEALDKANAPRALVNGDVELTDGNKEAIFTAGECGDNCQGHIITQNTQSGVVEAAKILVESGTHDITFSGLNLTSATVGIMPGGTMNLTLVDTNKIVGSTCGFYVPAGATLAVTEQSTGSLDISLGRVMAAAGIGGACFNPNEEEGDFNCGTVIINGGTITAAGRDYSAGIGGASYDPDFGNGGNITITGGHVTATGSDGAPGIGGGCNAGSDGSLTISSADVLAEGTVLGSRGEYFLTGVTADPTADMIVVPELEYTGEELDTDGIYIDDTQTATETLFRQPFQVEVDAEGWEKSFVPATVREAGDYIVTFTKGGKSIQKAFTVAGCLHRGETRYEPVGDGETHNEICVSCGAVLKTENCTFGNFAYQDETFHKGVCTCGREKPLEHRWKDNYPDSELDETTQTRRYSHTCTDCAHREETGTLVINGATPEIPYGQTAGIKLSVTGDLEKLGVTEIYWTDNEENPVTEKGKITEVFNLPAELECGNYIYKVFVTFADSTSLSFDSTFFVTVAPLPLTADMVTLSETAAVYDGTAHTPAVTVTHGNKTLTADTDYTVAYADNTNAGTATVTVTAIANGNYSGSVSKTFSIGRADVPENALTYTPPADLLYTGQPKIAVVTAGSLSGIGEIAIKYKKDNRGDLLAEAKGVGTYHVYADISAGQNYNAALIEVGSFTVSYMPAPTIRYNGWEKKDWYNRDVSVTADSAGYTVSDTSDGNYQDSYTISAQEGEVKKTLYFKDASGHMSDGVEVTVKFDLTPPTGSISVGAKWWQNLLSFVSFGHYAAKEYTVTINGEDKNGSGTAGIEYAVVTGTDQYTDTGELKKAVQAGKISWIPYDAGNKPTIPVSISQYVIYAKVTDNAGNVTYISTDGILLDQTPPAVGSLSVPEDTLKDVTAVIIFTVDEAGKYYYVLLDGNAANPSPADVIAACDPQTGAGGTAPADCVLKGSGTVTGEETESGVADITVNAAGLTPGAGYRLFVTAVDETLDITDAAEGIFAGNIADVSSVAFTMKKTNQAAPALSYQADRTNPADVKVTITPVNGAQYSFDGGQTWTDKNEQGGFTASDTVVLAIRLKETATHNQSPEQTLTIDLAKKDREAPSAFTLSVEANGETDYTVTIPATEGCEYSFDGEHWSDSNVKTGVKAGETVTGYKRYKETNDYNASSAVSASETMEKFTVKTPVISPAGGSYTGNVSVTITCASPDAEIYYTTDGSTPDRSSTRYTGAFTVTAPATVKAVAVKEGFTDSAVASAAYTKKSSGGSGSGGNGGGNSGGSGNNDGGGNADDSGNNGGGGISGDNGNNGGPGSGGDGSTNPGNGSTTPQIPATPPAQNTNPGNEATPGTGTTPVNPGIGNTVRPGTGSGNGAGTSVQGTKQPFIKGEDGKIGWDVIRAEEEKAQEGSTVNVDMNGSVVVPGDIFDSIKGRDITITFDMGDGILWSVDGKSITTDKAGDIDFSVKTGVNTVPVDIVNNVTGESYSIQLNLAYEGEFGFTAVLSINLGKENAGYTASLYYYNESTGELEFICADKVAQDGTVSLAVTHASDYVIAIDGDGEEGDGNVTEPAQPENTDQTAGNGAAQDSDGISSNPGAGQTGGGWWMIAILLLVVIIGAGVFVAVKRKRRGDR